MPYSVPTDTTLAFPAQGRPGHRRSYSNIAPPASYTSTSVSMSHLPRRRSAASAPTESPQRKPTFQLGRDDDDDDSSADEHDDRTLPPLRLKIKQSPFDAAVRRTSPPPQVSLQPPSAIPFPTVSPSPSQTSLLPSAQAPIPRALRPSMSRTSSTPIMLSNGKPLRSSLKSSSSSPNIPFPPQSLVPSIMFPELHPKHSHAYHQRARSAPSTPHLDHLDLITPSTSPSSTCDSPSLNSPSPPPSPTLLTHKNVHFPSQEEGGLATVRVFNRSAKPASLSRLGEETETETEGESSASGWGAPRANTWAPRPTANRVYPRSSSYNFPATPVRNSPLGRDPEKVLDLDPANSSPIPARGAEKGVGNVYLESIGFVRQGSENFAPKRPLTLTGTMLVRNVTYQKSVAIRFTMDDWHTTNDVAARYEKSLGALPGRFIRGASGALTQGPAADKERVCSPYAVDSVGDAAVAFGVPPAWDRFRFDINLEDYANSLENRTMWLVGRYSAGVAPGSAVQSPMDGMQTMAAPAEWWDNNLGANYRVGFERKEHDVQSENDQVYKRSPVVSAPSAYSPVRPTATSPPPKSYPAPPQISASVSFPMSLNEQQQQYAEQKQHQAAMTQSTMVRLKKLNLRNYAAPTRYTVPPTSAEANRITSSLHSSSTTTSTDSTPLQTPIQGNEDPVHVQKGTDQNVDVNVFQEDDVPFSSGPVRPNWGAALTPVLGMSMENGFPATFLPATSTSGNSTPTPTGGGLAAAAEMGTSPPFSSMADVGMAAMRNGASNAKHESMLYWPWGSLSNVDEQAATTPGQETPTQEKTQADVVSRPLSPPVASLLSGIREKSIAAGSGLGQLAPPQRRKGVHHHQHQSDPSGRASFSLGAANSSSSGSESGSATTKERRRGGGGGTASPLSSSPQNGPSSPPATSIGNPMAAWGLRPGSPRPGGTASPPFPGSPKRFLSPLPATFSSSGTRSPAGMGARSPLRLSPVNSFSELGADIALQPAGGATSPSGQDDAVYQAFVRQWCFAQAPGPSVGASVGASGSPAAPATPGVGVNV